jgi:hypothetical protein
LYANLIRGCLFKHRKSHRPNRHTFMIYKWALQGKEIKFQLLKDLLIKGCARISKINNKNFKIILSSLGNKGSCESISILSGLICTLVPPKFFLGSLIRVVCNICNIFQRWFLLTLSTYLNPTGFIFRNLVQYELHFYLFNIFVLYGPSKYISQFISQI